VSGQKLGISLLGEKGESPDRRSTLKANPHKRNAEPAKRKSGRKGKGARKRSAEKNKKQ